MNTKKQFTVAENMENGSCANKKKTRLTELRLLNHQVDWPVVAETVGLPIKKAKEALNDESSMFHQSIVEILDFVIDIRKKCVLNKTIW